MAKPFKGEQVVLKDKRKNWIPKQYKECINQAGNDDNADSNRGEKYLYNTLFFEIPEVVSAERTFKAEVYDNIQVILKERGQCN